MIRTSTMRNSVMFIVATVLAFGVETPATTVGKHADFLIQLGAIPFVCNALKVIHSNAEKVIHLRLLLTIQSGPL